MLTNREILLLTTLGKLNCLDEVALKHFGFGKNLLASLVSRKLVYHTNLDYYKETVKVYILSEKGRRAFKKYNKEKISFSRSIGHDYQHLKNVLSYLTIDNIKSYKNERFIRELYKDKIKELELLDGINISCPDCSIECQGKTIYIETFLSYIKPKLEEKKNFALVDKDIELIILRRNNNKIYHCKGGEIYDKEN